MLTAISSRFLPFSEMHPMSITNNNNNNNNNYCLLQYLVDYYVVYDR